jgi:hypothetical protein
MAAGSFFSRFAALAAGIALVGILSGCATARKLTTRDEFAELKADQAITVYAQDERVYALRQHALGDSAIRGSGTLSQRGQSSPFQGSIPFDQIIAVKTNSRSAMKGLAMVGITALFVAYLAEASRAQDGLTGHATVISAFTGSGSSCPYLYAWDGSRFELQAEPFGIAWGRALELTTAHLLPAARAEHGVVRLRLTNERQETHYADSIHLLAIELGEAAGAVLDGQGRAWPLEHPVAPVAARDESEGDLLPEVAAVDGRLWECDLSRLTPTSGYEDVLEFEFVRPRETGSGLLVLTGINTALSSAVYSSLCRVVGGEAALLAHAIETDPELIAQLRRYLRDASLEVRLWNGRDWEVAGVLQPEASAVTFTRALRIAVPPGAGDTVKVRLRSMADVWRIDALAAEWGDSRPLPMQSLDMLSAVGPAGEDVRDALGRDDERRAVLLPPDRVELAFSAARPSQARGRVVYAVTARGYLHEWDPRPQGDDAVAGFLPISEEHPIEILKRLLDHRDQVLQPVYETWRRTRTH